MVIFHSYVSLPEGIPFPDFIRSSSINHLFWESHQVSTFINHLQVSTKLQHLQGFLSENISTIYHRIGWWENPNRKPLYLMVKTHGFFPHTNSLIFPLKPTKRMDMMKPYKSWDVYHRFQLVIRISLAHPQYQPRPKELSLLKMSESELGSCQAKSRWKNILGIHQK